MVQDAQKLVAAKTVLALATKYRSNRLLGGWCLQHHRLETTSPPCFCGGRD